MAFAAGRRGAAAALMLDQVRIELLPSPSTVAGLRIGGGDHRAIDDNNAQVVAGDKFLDQHLIADQPRLLDGARDFVLGCEIDEDAAALLAARRLDHDMAMPLQKRRRFRRSS